MPTYLSEKVFLNFFEFLEASDVLAVELLQKDARLAAIGELGKACPGGATVFISTTSLKVDIQRRCLPQQRLRMPTFKDGVEVSD
ncbi:hypothetical protein JHK87_027362 [Glycine soja]|nr:hypothetical protein JHK87_027362 [Glycine soja]